MKKRLIIDTDIGTDVDDGIAIAYLCNEKKQTIVGISTVGGNAKLRRDITYTFLEKLGRTDIPLFAGFDESLDGVKGYTSGVEGTNYDVLTAPSQEKGSLVEWYEHKLSGTKKTSILAIGALTNIATVLKERPDLESKIEHIYFMGGIDENAFSKGTVRPKKSSHNVKEDYKAAKYIFETAIPMTILQKDIPLQHPYTIAEFQTHYQNGTSIGDLLYLHAHEMISFSKRNSVCLYDPILAAIIGDKSLYEGEILGNREIIRNIHFEPKKRIEDIVLGGKI